ncbi:hypothetical protein DXG01_012614 [Tephrocybe rancida]|nr:hypothetical protein DXG01_012614 [Tephrocybe rancida]
MTGSYKTPTGDETPTPTASATMDPEIEKTAEISFKIREAIRQSLPAPKEQFFTVMVPGKVVNFADFTEGFDSDGHLTTPVLPTSVELAQAMLCDDMPVFGPVQLGPTGRSVAGSYDMAISKLVPTGTTIGRDIVEGAEFDNLPEAEKQHHKAMAWLTERDPKHDNKTRVEVYGTKQAAHTKAVENKIKAFDDALTRAMNDPLNTSIASRRAAYDNWVNENSRTYRNSVQAAYMDWIVNGNKEEVEYWFSIVDRQTAMACVEASKEAMRNAVVMDTDGSAEFNKVRLSPTNWAVIAHQKAQSGNNQTRTVEWYTWEVSRLKKMNSLLDAMMATTPQGDTPVAAGTAAIQNSDTHLTETMTKFLKARDAYEKAERTDPKPSKNERQALYKTYNDARSELDEEKLKKNKEDVQAITHFAQDAQDKMHKKLADEGMAPKWKQENADKITQYTAAINALLKSQEGPDNGLIQRVARDAKIPDPYPDPSVPKKEGPDYFTAISVEISSSSSEETSTSHATAASFGASFAYGLFGLSASASHSDAASDAAKAMASSSVKIAFECMRVDITRSWLRSELFFDSELTTGPKQVISPGYGRLRALLEGTAKPNAGESIQDEIQRYSTFPMYPTAFLLAANVVLEISGETSAIQNHFKTSSTSGGGSLGYGPFSISSSVSHTQTSTSSEFKATASGCRASRITIKSPQIIGWISQMVPALPRLKQPKSTGGSDDEWSKFWSKPATS